MHLPRAVGLMCDPSVPPGTELQPTLAQLSFLLQGSVARRVLAIFTGQGDAAL